ncbi:MAG: NAD(P)-dependent oxidoreductase [Candidatus Latescibacteria bacterium]|nr:NAD(P)-dependent oxidoreductase [Candidatus Latescibacterota bacterium]
MRVLITGAASRLGQAIAARLRDRHHLRLLDSTPLEPGPNATSMQASLLDPQAMWQAVRNIDAVIHTGEPPADLPGDELARDQLLLDLATRGTHVLFLAAAEAGIKRLVYTGTLEVFAEYPDEVYISEMWKPLPPPAMPVLSRYLGELTCREFTRDYMVGITALRLGRLVLEEEVAGQPGDLMWLDLRDAAQAVECALQRDTSQRVWWTQRWGLYHVVAPINNAKFLISQAAQLGYKPEHAFAAHWAGGQA